MPVNTLQDWFATPLGEYLLEKEQAYLDDVTPDIFGFHALQLGMPATDFLRASRITHRMRIAASDSPDLYAKSHELPLATQSIQRRLASVARTEVSPLAFSAMFFFLAHEAM